MILLECPNCGRRNVQEFRYGGEYNPRPKAPMDAPDTKWVDYIFMRGNKSGIQKEWWFHRAGCGYWFLAERHTKSNRVIKTFLQPDKEEM
jgi:sarcosine oxidase subunit delta